MTTMKRARAGNLATPLSGPLTGPRLTPQMTKKDQARRDRAVAFPLLRAAMNDMYERSLAAPDDPRLRDFARVLTALDVTAASGDYAALDAMSAALSSKDLLGRRAWTMSLARSDSRRLPPRERTDRPRLLRALIETAMKMLEERWPARSIGGHLVGMATNMFPSLEQSSTAEDAVAAKASALANVPRGAGEKLVLAVLIACGMHRADAADWMKGTETGPRARGKATKIELVR